MSFVNKRVPAPCKDRENIYFLLANLSSEEIKKVNCDLLNWILKTASGEHQQPNVFSQGEVEPQNFMDVMCNEKGILLKKLAIRLGNFEEEEVNESKSSYEVFYKFARYVAKLAEGCIFLEDEIFGDPREIENYKSVFYTLYKLSLQARVKFGVPTIYEMIE